MFEGGVLPRVPAGGAARTLSAPAQDVSLEAVGCAEEVAGLLGSLAAGGELAGVVEGLLARLLVTAQNPNDDEDSAADGGGGGEGSDADGAGSVDGEGLFAGDSGGDAALVAGAEGLRVVSLEEAGGTGVLGLGAVGLGELVAACHRLVAWASWGQSLAAACLTACGELSTHPGQWGPDGRVSSVVGFEERRFNTTCLLSARLGVSRSRAGRIVDHGSALMDVGFGPTEVLERCGVLDAAKASLVTRRLEGVPAPVALAVQERVLPQAPRRSVSQVGRDIERALMETDPTGHSERARVNQERRCVTRPRPAGEGLSQVRLLLPTMDALLLDATLDAIAASARACGEQRTPAQLRADAITAMTLSALRTSQQTAFTQPSPKEADHDGEAQAEANLSGPATQVRLLPDGVPLEGLLGALSSLVGSASPWWTPSGTGHLPLPESIHIDVQVTVPLTSLTDPGGLAQPEDATDHTPAAHGPGGREPATSIGGNRLQDSDHGGYVPEGCAPKCGVPESAERPEGPCHPKSGRASPDKSPTIVTPDPLNDAASPHDRRGLPTTDGRSLPGSSGRSLPEPAPAAPASQPAASCSTAPASQPAVQPAVSLSAAATGVAQVRVGVRSVAVTALTAWALAAGGTWRRLVTDPASGTVVDVGRARYRPPAGLADLVRARDRACVFPTCHTPASRCDIDHLTAWSQGGTTSLDNLVVLCQAHHRLKHTPGWALTRDNTSGTLSWHTPDKTIYQRHPDGSITRLPHKTGPHQHHTPATVIPKDLSQQISPDILNRLNRALDTALDNHTGPGTNTNINGTARLETRGPQPGHKPGAFETTPYPKAAHTLGLAPLIDQTPPF
ncbi:HNH endonuclease signature motif containing protein [Actinomyces oris]|uniref:HNH endonuclease signature motif containing protein n=1 Tax=Actinomyces oris TaxID=544580 RepID=UPI0026F31502|nr:HNH endonuclease signature motif containing protein [Actinomyces oris]